MQTQKDPQGNINGSKRPTRRKIQEEVGGQDREEKEKKSRTNINRKKNQKKKTNCKQQKKKGSRTIDIGMELSKAKRTGLGRVK